MIVIILLVIGSLAFLISNLTWWQLLRAYRAAYRDCMQSEQMALAKVRLLERELTERRVHRAIAESAIYPSREVRH